MGQVEEKGNERIGLKRELGLFSAVSIILAVMIGMKTIRKCGTLQLILRGAMFRDFRRSYVQLEIFNNKCFLPVQRNARSAGLTGVIN